MNPSAGLYMFLYGFFSCLGFVCIIIIMMVHDEIYKWKKLRCAITYRHIQQNNYDANIMLGRNGIRDYHIAVKNLRKSREEESLNHKGENK